MQIVAMARGRGASRASWRSLTFGALLVLSVIVGLLTMCTVNAHAGAPTHTAPLQAVASVADHPTLVASVGHPAAPLPAMCDDCGAASDGDGTLGMALACAMALLAFLVVLPLPGRSSIRIAGIVRAGTVTPVRSVTHRETPSLHVLCISRT